VGCAGGAKSDAGGLVIMNKVYNILLEKFKIGTTAFEKADAPMGVVFGNISFVNIPSPYKFFKEYCLLNSIVFTDYPEDKFISTFDIPNLQIIDLDGIEIKGISNSIAGMDNEDYEISIIGIPYPFYEKEFPHHVKLYNNLFKS
jgi:hypothetical protein